MKAAAITSFDQPPHDSDLVDPVPEEPKEMLVEMLAAGLHHVTRSRASGAHYSSIDVKALPCRNVAQAWGEAAHTSERIVFTP